MKKVILSYWVKHENDKLGHFRITWDCIWVLIKNMIFRGKKITTTVIKYPECEEYLIQFFAE